MEKLLNIKLNNGEELLAKFVNDDGKIITIKDVLQVDVTPDVGIFCKLWPFLSEVVDIELDKSRHVFYIQQASDNAKSYYKEFMDNIRNKDSNEVFDDDLNEPITMH